MSALAKKSSVNKKSSAKNQTLDLLPTGGSGTVISVTGAGVVSKRLMEMGLVPGALIHLIKTAPLGDPIEIAIGPSHLALRKTEAQRILVFPEISAAKLSRKTIKKNKR